MNMPILFTPAASTLEPLAVVGVDEVARRLAERLLQSTDEQLRALRGVAAPGLIAALGDSTELPWVDGVLYLGRDPLAPRLYVPTSLQPDVPYELLERALLSAAKPLAPPLGLLPSPRRLFSLADALPITRAALLRWCAR